MVNPLLAAQSNTFPGTNTAIPGSNNSLPAYVTNPNAPYVNKPATSPLAQQYNTYNTAVQQQAGDYDSIMNNLSSLYNTVAQTPKLNYQPYTPQQYNYTPSQDVTSSLSTLSNLANTGGYSQSDINDLRARGISPIRSVYSSAQQNIDRQKALQGGYSPNYTAATAKLTRDEAQQISDAEQNVNAGIAQNVASNEIQAAPSYASAAAGQSALQNQYAAQNVANANQAQQFNIQEPLAYAQYNAQVPQTLADILKSQTGLYGTTPALSSLFGTQALNGAQLQNNINQQNKQQGLNIVGQLVGGLS
jgi:hypothetical protein